MEGNGRVRYCLQCRKNVYNLSEMSGQEAADLVTKTEGRLCVRFYRREDGTMLTQNCPVGARLAWQKLKSVAASILVTLSGIGGVIGLGVLAGRLRGETVSNRPPPGQIVPPPGTFAVVGKMGPLPPVYLGSVGPSPVSNTNAVPRCVDEPLAPKTADDSSNQSDQ